MENNENTVDSTILKLLKGVNGEDLKEKLVEGFTVEKSGDIIEREREPRVLIMLAWSYCCDDRSFVVMKISYLRHFFSKLDAELK